MVCPKCNSKLGVTDSRQTEAYIRRRRICTKCDYKFTTYEMLDSEYIEKIEKENKELRKKVDKITEIINDGKD
jgi:transcriptional regulator NrdR family protein